MKLLWRRQHTGMVPRSLSLGVHNQYDTLPVNEGVVVNTMDFKPLVRLFHMTQVIRWRPPICWFWVIQKRYPLGWFWTKVNSLPSWRERLEVIKIALLWTSKLLCCKVLKEGTTWQGPEGRVWLTVSKARIWDLIPTSAREWMLPIIWKVCKQVLP